VNDSIFINAKSSIVLKAGQSSIKLEGANITMACPGTFSVKGSGHSFDAGASAPAETPKLPDSRVKMFDEQFAMVGPDGEPLANIPHSINGSDGKEIAISQDGGKTSRVSTEAGDKLKLAMRFHNLS